MSQRTPLLPMLLLGAFIAPLHANTAQGSAGEITRKANAVLAEYMASESADAVSALIAIGDESIFEGGVGAQEPGSHKTADVETSFSAEGLAHTFLVTAALQYESNKKLSSNDLVVTHLPDMLPADSPVRVGELMSHTSGLADIRDFAKPDTLAAERPTYLALAATVLDIVPETAPGECVAVTSTNTLLLAALLEKVSGQTADEVLQVVIFDKLEMMDTNYSLGAPIREASAGEEPDSQPAFIPSGLSSTASDLSKFHRGLQDKRLLDTSTLERMGSVTRLTDGSTSNHGLGLRHVELHDASGTVVGDSEGAGTGACQVAHYPEFDLTVIVMARGQDLRVEGLARDLARLMIQKPEATTLDLLLEPQELAPYMGNFQIGCSTLVIGSDAGRVVLDEIDQDPIVFLYQGEHRFIARNDSDITITFELRGEVATAFSLERHGMMTRAVRLMRK